MVRQERSAAIVAALFDLWEKTSRSLFPRGSQARQKLFNRWRRNV
jgi:hypothetical protein